MQTNSSKFCGAPWGCTELSSRGSGKRSWKVDDVELCRKCYSYTWEHAKDQGKTMSEIFLTLPGPQRPLPSIATQCARKGCTEAFRKNEGSLRRRHIGLLHVCVACYQAAWELSRTFEPVISLEQAFKLLPEKGWHKVPKYQEVECCMPWCRDHILNHPGNLVAEGLYVCGKCRTYLKNTVTVRYQYTGKDWIHWAVEAVKGRVIPPKMAEHCAMPWCRAVIEPTAFGPQGQPICRTDEVRLQLYAKRFGITFDEAFLTAPPPRWGIKRKVGIPDNLG